MFFISHVSFSLTKIFYLLLAFGSRNLIDCSGKTNDRVHARGYFLFNKNTASMMPAKIIKNKTGDIFGADA